MSDERRAYYVKFINVVANMTYRKLAEFKEFVNDSTLDNIDMVDLVKQVNSFEHKGGGSTSSHGVQF